MTATDSGVWPRPIEFPPPGATIASMVAGGPGFVAVGSVPRENSSCEEPAAELTDGRVWTSADGVGWSEAAAVELADMRVVVNAGGILYAFGLVGSGGCPGSITPGGVTIWRSFDGAIWEQLPQSATFLPWDEIYDVAVSGDTLVAVGSLNTNDDRTGVWTSPDGITWERSGDSPRWWTHSIDGVASAGEILVATTSDVRPIWYSTDRGRTWAQSTFEPSYGLRSLDLASHDGLVVAVGSACCGLPDTQVGVAFSSRDGHTWAASDPQAFRRVSDHAVALPDGFLSVGRQSRLSSDGVAWQVGPAMPDFDWDSPVALAASRDLVVAATGAGVWSTAVNELSIDRWPELARAPEMPELGVRYPYDLFSHCGIPPIYFALQSWVPLGDPGVNPPPGFADNEEGWLTQISASEAEFSSRNGGTIRLKLGAQPPAEGACA